MTNDFKINYTLLEALKRGFIMTHNCIYIYIYYNNITSNDARILTVV